jgi:hypothetical protein
MKSNNNSRNNSKDSDGGVEQRIEAVMHLAEQLAANDVRDGYTHIGAASSGAFRFRWTARQQSDGRFIVEETVGGGRVAVKSRPIARDEVLSYIDGRQRRIQAKIDEIKRELADIQGITEEEPKEVERDPQQMYDEIRRLLKESK